MWLRNLLERLEKARRAWNPSPAKPVGRRHRERAMQLEPLEQRTLLSLGSPLDGDLVIGADDPGGNGSGNGSADEFRLVLNGPNLEVYLDGALSQSVPFAAVNSVTVNGSEDTDTLIVDFLGGSPVPVGGVSFAGSGAGDSDLLKVIGNGGNRASYTPSAATFGDGEVDMDGGVITFTGLEPTVVSNVASLTFTTPGSADDVSVTNPSPGVTLVEGTSDGVPFESLSFFDVGEFILDSASNDSGGDDTIVVAPAVNGLTGSGAVTREAEPNGTAATATPLPADHIGDGAITPNNDEDFWVSSGASVGDLVFAYVDTQTSTTSKDSFLKVIADDGTTVIETDDDDGPANSSVVAGAEVPQAGSVYFDVSSFGGALMSHYELYTAVVNPSDTAAETEPNDTAAEATAVSATMMTGDVSGADLDYYSFSATMGDRIVVMMDDDPGRDGLLTDTDLFILGEDGVTVLATGDNGGNNDGNAAGAVLSAPATGTYYVRVGNGGGGADSDYRFVVQVLNAGRSLADFSVRTGPGADTLDVSLPYTLAGGAFFYDAGGATADSDRLIVRAPAGAVESTLEVRDGQVEVLGQQPITYNNTQLGYQDTIALFTGDGNDLTRVFLPGFHVLPQVSVDGEGGADALVVFGRAGVNETFQAVPTGAAAGSISETTASGQVTTFVNVSLSAAVDGVDGNDTLSVSGRAGVSDNITVGPDAVAQGRVAIATLVPVLFDNLDAVSVAGGDEATGDHITVQPLAIPVSVDGGNPTLAALPLGDRLTVDVTGVPGAAHIAITVTGLGQGVTQVDAFAPVTFTHIERFDTLGLAADMDYGDAPDPTFPTLSASNGAAHIISPSYFLGAQVDSEFDGQPSGGANGDDLAGVDDEDGVVFLDPLLAGGSVQVRVTASAPGLLNAWIDFNNDGDWNDSGERIFTNRALVAGPNTLSFAVPATAVPSTQAYSRFRFSTSSGLLPTGVAPDGEVEDYVLSIQAYDYGDAPDPSYPTLLASNGARHTIVPGFYLGAGVDGELDGQPDANATGDDLAGIDDEDGVVFLTPLRVGGAAQVQVAASQAGALDAWIDFNDDGDWDDAGEQIFASQALVAGLNTLTFAVPASGIGTPQTFARFRLSSTGGLAVTGLAADGEVEDYAVEISNIDFGDAPDPTYPTLEASDGARHNIVAGVYLGAAVDGESDGQPNAAATGDDLAGIDDEDGVTFVAPLTPGGTAQVDVTASVDGLLNAWVDYNDDGDWTDPGEQIFTDRALTAGANSLTFVVPVTATLTPETYARFRFDTTGGLAPVGLAADGEVEDYAVSIDSYDFGDAPDPTYPTLVSSGGAQHRIVAGFFLGATIDSESDGQPDAVALGDDLAGVDDEDGVTFLSTLAPGLLTQVSVVASQAGLLDAWIDFDGDGAWSGGEQIFTNEPLTAGPNTLVFAVPGGAAVTPLTFARFRFSSAGGLAPTGLASDGEVEDYAVAISPLVIHANLNPPGGATNDGVADVFLIRLNGANVEVEVNGAVVLSTPMADLPSIQFGGSDDEDTLIVDNSGGLVSLPGGIFFDGEYPGIAMLGNTGEDTLVIQGDDPVWGPVARETYTTLIPGWGTVVLDPDGSAGIGATAFLDNEEVIVFSNLAPIDDTTAAVNYDFFATAAPDLIQVVDGPVVSGFQTTQINDGGTSAFELVNFANKQNVSVNGMGDSDIVLLDNPTPADGLETLAAYGHDLTGGDANLDEQELFLVYSKAATVTLQLFGEGGDDVFDLQDMGSLDRILGDALHPLDIDGGDLAETLGDALTLSDYASLVADPTITVTSTSITNMAPSPVNYGQIEDLALNTTDNADTVMEVLSIDAQTRLELTLFGFTAQVTVGNYAANFGDGNGNLDAILGRLTIIASIGPAGVITLRLDDTGDTTADVATIGVVGGETEINGLGSDVISYETGVVDTLEILAGSGGNTIDVTETTALSATSIDSGAGDDSVTINADGLTGANTFTGNTGADAFVLNVTSDVGGTSLAIRGDPVLDPATPDRLDINDVGGVVRNLNFDYSTPIDGGLVVGGFAVNVDVATMETVSYSGATVGDYDVATVNATTDPDNITVIPTGMNSATVLMEGGVGAGAAGPDLNLAGIQNNATPGSFGLTINGSLPPFFSDPGDKLIYDGSGTNTVLGPGEGVITSGGAIAVHYVSIETVEATGQLGIEIDADDGPNTHTNDGLGDFFLVVRDGDNLQVYVSDDAVFDLSELVINQVFTSVSGVVIAGSGDQDTLFVRATGGIVNLPDWIVYDGQMLGVNAPGVSDSLIFDGTDPFQPVLRETYVAGLTLGLGARDGVVVFDPDDLVGADYVNNFAALDGNEQVVQFFRLAPIFDVTPVAAMDIFATPGADPTAILDGLGDPINYPGVVTTLVTAPSFESVEFANKTAVSVNGLDGGDLFQMNNPNAADGLTTLDVYGNELTNGLIESDDAAGDNFDLIATGAAVSLTRLSGQGGSDLFTNVAITPTYTLDGLAGNLDLVGGPGIDAVQLQDPLDLSADLVTLDAVSLTGAAPGVITYSEVEGFVYEATQSDDTIDVLSTALGTTYVVSGDGGSDTFTIGTDTASFDTGAGTLDGVLGPITFVADFNGPAGLADTLNVDDTGALGADVAAISDAAGGLLLARTTTLTGFAPVPIAYEYTPGTEEMEFVNIRGSQGGNTIAVDATTASLATTLDSGAGDDAVSISGSDLSGDNLFTGNTGNDQFALSIGADLGSTAVFPFVGLEIQGNDPAADTDNRDSLAIDDLGGGARTLGFVYQAGDGLDLAGFAQPIVIRTMETLIYNGDPGNDDRVVVAGTPGDDALTVAPLDGSTAMVFIGGDPWDGPDTEGSFFDQYPGVAGGSTGPDVLIRGIDPSGVTVDGGGGTADRLYVYGPSEDPLVDPLTTIDPFGFGSGVIVPGFGVGGAYDQISMADFGVTITNNSVGALVPVSIVTASFVQGNPLDPGLVVNAGFEVLPDPVTGIADDIVAALSVNFAMQVNGGDPDPNLSPVDNIPPEGDRLEVLTPDDVNVYASKGANPGDEPVVTVTSGSALGLSFSSIESVTLTPGNASQTVNIIGDNNDPTVDQNDNFVIVGADVDSLLPPIPGAKEQFQPDVDGANEFFLQINGSSPIGFRNVRFLNVFGDDQNPPPGTPSVGPNDVDRLEVTPYADNTPLGWGIDVRFDEGNPVLDGIDNPDLLVYNGVPGVSEEILVQPSGPGSGQLIVRNAADGSLIVAIDYTTNTGIVVNGNDGTAGDTDRLILRGTDGVASPSTSGNENVTVDFTAAGIAADPIISVADADTAAVLYQVINFTNFDNLTLDLDAGNDQVTVLGRTNGADIDMVGLTVLGGAGDDRLVVDNTDGLADLPDGILFEGGAGSDAVVLTGTTVVDSSLYAAGSTAGEGRVIQVAGAVEQNVVFRDAELVVDQVESALLTVAATDGDNAINYGLGQTPDYGRVTIDGLVPIEFLGKAELLIDALAGDDVINLVNDPTIPVGLAGIRVAGGDPSASDTLVVNAVPGVFDPLVVEPTAQGAGTVVNSAAVAVPVDFTGIEQLLLVGQLTDGDTMGVDGTAGDDLIEYFPGATPDAGTVVATWDQANLTGFGPFSLPAIGFSGMTQASVLTFNAFIQTGGADTFVFHGTDGNDNVTLLGGVIDNVVNGQLTSSVDFGDSTAVVLDGGEGDDAFSVTPDLIAAVTVLGGDPSAGDTLVFSGTGAGAVTLDLAARTVTEAGFAAVSFSGVEQVTIDAAGQGVTVNGTAGDDTIAFAPTGAASGQLTLAGLNAVFDFLNVGTLAVDALGGSDLLTVNATQDSDTIDVDGTAVDVNGRLPVAYAGFEALTVNGLAGDDTFNVTPAAIPIFVDGGDPIGTTPGDLLTIVGGPAIFEPGPETDEGSFRVSGAERVSFDHIEAFTVTVGPVLILGTNGDDDITVIARDNTYNPADPGTPNPNANLDGVQDFTVSVNQGPEWLFVDVAELYIDALAGDDDIVVRTPAPAAVGDWNVQLWVAGGTPAAYENPLGDTLELETPGQASVVFTPTGQETGLLLLDQATNDSLITIGPFQLPDLADPDGVFYESSPGGVEHLVYDGQAGDDTLTVLGTQGDDTIVHAPGEQIDAGRVAVNSLLPISYENLGALGTVTIDGDGGIDSLVYEGTPLDDHFTVENLTGTVTLETTALVGFRQHIPVLRAGVEFLELNALEGDDTFDLGSRPGYDGVFVNGGGPGSSDRLTVSGIVGAVDAFQVALDSGSGNGTVIANLVGIVYTGVEQVNVLGNPLEDDTLVVAGDLAADVWEVDRGSLLYGTRVQIEGRETIEFTDIDGGVELRPDAIGIGGADRFRVHPAFIGDLTVTGSGVDVLDIVGTAQADIATVTSTDVTLSITTVSYSQIAQLNVLTLEGDDTINVSATGAGRPALTVDGGLPTASDTLNITNLTAGTTTVAPGETPDSGVVTTLDGVTSFLGMEFVTIAGTAGFDTLVTQGTHDNDTIAASFLNAANRVWINDRAVVAFSAFETLTLQGRFGSDEFSVIPAGPFGLVGVTTINVQGGDPTASDRLVVTGTTGADAFDLRPLAADAATLLSGAVTMNISTTESLEINGLGGGDALTMTTPAGFTHVIALTPGATADAGTIVAARIGGAPLLPVEFTGLGAAGSLSFANAGPAIDRLEVYGTAASDVFTVLGGIVQVEMLDPFGSGTVPVTLPISTPGIGPLVLHGLEGDDAFNLVGTDVFDEVQIDAGDPSASDVVTLTGDGSSISASVGTSTVTVSGGGLGSVAVTGAEILNLAALGGDLTLEDPNPGSASMAVTPTSANGGTAVAEGVSPVVNFSDVGTLLVLFVSPDSELTVNATVGADNPITVTGSLVAVPGVETVNYSGAGALRVYGREGDDRFEVTPALIPIFIDGGDPIGTTPGDSLFVVPLGPMTFEPGPENDEGSFVTAGFERVSFDHIEGLGVSPGPGPVIIIGTNADDDITIIARDAISSPQYPTTDGVRDFTVSVNAGPEILFVNTATLYVDALAGDDDVVVRAPSPNAAGDWDVDLFVAGGTPAADGGRLGDVLELETPGTNTVVYRPTGPDTGTLVLDQATNDSTITMGPFQVILVPGPEPELYTSSPGGMEHVTYDGENGDDTLRVVTPAGADQIDFTPGATADSASLTLRAALGATLLGIDYQNLGSNGGLVLADAGGGRADDLTVNGRVAANAREEFRVGTDGLAAGQIQVLDGTSGLGSTVLVTVVIEAAGAAELRLNGLAGDDVFRITGGHPFGMGVVVDGGEPSASDVLEFLGTGDDIQVQLDNTPASAPYASITEDAHAPVFTTGVEDVSINAAGQGLVVMGTADDDQITYRPLTPTSGQFQNAGDNTRYAFEAVGLAFFIGGGTDVGDEVIVEGTENRDVITADAVNRTVTVENAAGVVLKPVVLGTTVEIATVHALGGNDTIVAVPAPGVGDFPLTNLLVNVDGGDPAASDALVIAADAQGTPLPNASTFVVVSRSLEPNAGVVRVFQDTPGAGNAPTQLPDIAYTNVEVVSPLLSGVGPTGDPNLLILGPDAYEPNEYRGTAAFVGSGAALNVQDLAVFPNAFEHRFVPADQDWFRYVAKETGTLDFQVYFQQYSAELLPGGGNLDVFVYDATGDLIGSSTSATANERIAIPVVRNQTYYLRVVGAGDTVINGYDMTAINVVAPVPFQVDLRAASDSGRSNGDNITRTTTPSFDIYLDDDRLQEFTNLGLVADNVLNQVRDGDYGVEVYNNGVFLGLATYVGPAPGTPATNRWVYTATAGQLQEGDNNFITAAVWIKDRATPAVVGRGELGPALQVALDTAAPPASFGDAAVADDGLHPDSDSGVAGLPATLTDRITNDTTPTFYGVAEADAIIRAYVDTNLNGLVDAADVFIGMTVAVPEDGNQAYPNGQWELTSVVNMNDREAKPTALPLDGLRRILITAEDRAGNVATRGQLEIFIDTQGPTIQNVFVTGNPGFDLFETKPSTSGPTPLVTSLSISVRDLPNRVAQFLYDALAYQAGSGKFAEDPGNYLLVGDHNGVIAIQSVTFFPDAPLPGQPATGTLVLTFAQPLPDDRFTLTISDDVTDPAGNRLDGETNAIEPLDNPTFPTGDRVPGGDFVARFTIDSRPELAVWAAGSVWVDTNGNGLFDPNNLDFTNRDITYTLGFTSDDIFAGNFARLPGSAADGFDKLAAYGRVGTQFRWLVDTNNDGVPEVAQNDPANVNGLPFAGRFDNSDANGDEVGVVYSPVTGSTSTWYFDTNHDFMVDYSLVSQLKGYPIIGDFDGDGFDDLATWTDDVFQVDLAKGVRRGWDGVIDKTFGVGFIGVRERPVAGDLNRDGKDDFGLFVPDRSGTPPAEGAEWYFLLSDPATGKSVLDRIVPDPISGKPIVPFTPVPFGNDLFAQFGDEFAVPVLGNFDPPVSGSGAPSKTVTLNGTSGNDRLEFVAGAAAGSWIVKLNGVTQAIDPEATALEFFGGDGYDAVSFTGTAGADSADLWADRGTFTGSGYVLTVAGAEQFSVDGQGGDDVVNLYDTPGKETFIASPGTATFTGATLAHSVRGVQTIRAFAAEGGDDTAFLYDSDGNDLLVASPAQATMSGDGYSNQAVGFGTVHGYSTHAGQDVAHLYDGAGDDSFTGKSDHSVLFGDGFYVRAKLFEQVFAHATGGGNDTATLNDSAGNDALVATPTEATLSGQGFSYTADSFEMLLSYARFGGTDKATLTGSAGNDTLIVAGDYAKLFGEGYFARPKFFEEVVVQAGPDGADTARLGDSAGDDRFLGRPGQADLYTPKYHYQALGFDTVSATASLGYDTAYLYDSAADDTFTATPTSAKLVGPGYSLQVTAFDAMLAQASTGADSAFLYDSAGDDKLTAKPDQTVLSGTGYYLRARAFDAVYSYATGGGRDVAELWGSAGNDKLYGDRNETRLSGTGFYNRAKFFDEVTARTLTGTDKAELVDVGILSGTLARSDSRLPAVLTRIAWLYNLDEIQVRNKPEDGGQQTIQAVDQIFTAYWK